MELFQSSDLLPLGQCFLNQSCNPSRELT